MPHSSAHPVFFLITPRPPSSPLFPYTTLFRSMDFEFSAEQVAIRDTIRELVQDRVSPRAAEIDRTGEYPRSEEHTSELQSRRDLVCRLLLEKKNLTAQECMSGWQLAHHQTDMH